MAQDPLSSLISSGSEAAFQASQSLDSSLSSISSFFEPVRQRPDNKLPLTLAKRINPRYDPKYDRFSFRLIPRGCFKAKYYRRFAIVALKGHKRKRTSVAWENGEELHEIGPGASDQRFYYCYSTAISGKSLSLT